MKGNIIDISNNAFHNKGIMPQTYFQTKWCKGIIYECTLSLIRAQFLYMIPQAFYDTSTHEKKVFPYCATSDKRVCTKETKSLNSLCEDLIMLLYFKAILYLSVLQGIRDVKVQFLKKKIRPASRSSEILRRAGQAACQVD